jgi:type II secretory pathway pseudopilin PulG
MNQRRFEGGFTLIEVLVSAVILTAVLGTLFSVLSALRKSANFRSNNLAVTQATNFAFEQIAQNVKSGNHIESIWDPTIAPGGGCQTMRGFYIVENGQIRTTIDTPNLASNQSLVVINKEKRTDGTYYYLKREYTIGSNDPDASGVINPTIIETTYQANPDPGYNGGLGWEWPVHHYASCDPSSSTTLHWDQDPSRILTRKLTANNAKVTRFGVRMSAPSVNPANLELLNSPFISLEITSAHPSDATVPTFTLRSTITPTFAYGDQRD